MDPNTAAVISVGISLVNVIVLIVLVSKLTRLSRQIPGTGATAEEIGKELGGSIESSFEKFMPKPEKVSDAITSSVEAALKTATSGLGDVQKAIGTAADKLGGGLGDGSEKLKSALTDGSEKLKSVLSDGSAKLESTLSGAGGSIGSALKDGSAKLEAALTGATSKLESTLTGGSEKLSSSLNDGSKKLSDALSGGAANIESALKEHADKVAQASRDLSAQLEKIATLEKEIDKLLHIQEATEGTLKSVSASEDFKKLVSGLNTHLDASDKVLKELTKPRQIRLVEEE